MDFTELEKLRSLVAELRQTHVAALKEYYNPTTNGFVRKRETRDRPRLSLASTATCLASLLAPGKYDSPECSAWRSRQQELTDQLLMAKRQSAGLENTAFTNAFVLETVTSLCDRGVTLDTGQKADVSKWEATLKGSLNSRQHPGAVAIEVYPPTAYVTQLVVRTLKPRGLLDQKTRRAVRLWTVGEINRQIGLFASAEKTADAYALAYSTILLGNLSSSEESTPEEARLERAAIKLFFDKQLDDGTWPSSRPLFHYPKAGNAYCFEYEMLVQLLITESLQPILLDHIDKLAKATSSLKNRAFRFESGALAWASGHHPQSPGPESWSTASVYHFLYQLDRLIAEAVRQSIFVYLDQLYKKPTETKPAIYGFLPASDFLDSLLWIDEKSFSLRNALIEFVEPIAKGANAVRATGSLPSGTKMSAIFFGPPGTSKTELAKQIAEFLGWPHLSIDPSHLVKFGMDRVQAEANTVFSMLAASEEIVVLLDEFDEMVRERASSDSEVLSRFLTTAMLPKLSLINKRRSIVFILATNHIEEFDFAISRMGRFDRIFQIMPPSASEKRRKWDALNRVPSSEDAKLELLTFSECEKLAERLRVPEMDPNIALAEALKTCTLKKNARPLRSQEESPLTWEEECKAQRKQVRL
jgi:ATPase family associated with various cellular activities (AAA)